MSRQPVEAGNFGIGSGSAAAGFQVMEKRRIQADGSDAHLFFRLRPGAYEGDSHIAFLTDLHRFEGGRHGAAAKADCARYHAFRGKGRPMGSGEPSSVCERLRRLRKAAGLTQKDWPSERR